MTDMSGSELLLIAGVAVMAGSALLAVISLIGFRVSGKRLKGKLEQEYGKLDRKL